MQASLTQARIAHAGVAGVRLFVRLRLLLSDWLATH
jgi:hypothetical protein